MNSTHIKEANIEQDLYYTGIAEKAYDKVVRFLSKHKSKLEGGGESGIINKPFIAIHQYQGVAISGRKIDKDFPGFRDVLFCFVPEILKGKYKIKGGISTKPIDAEGVTHKATIVITNLIGPYDGQYIDTRLAGNHKQPFIHEYIHYLDFLRYRNRGISEPNARYMDRGDYEAYYNTPEEFNAFYQEGQSELVRSWKNLSDRFAHRPEFLNDFKKEKLKSYKAFQDWVIGVEFFNRDFITHINGKYLKKFKKRLANLYMYIQKGNMKNTKESLKEVAMNKDNVHEFIKFAKNALQLKEKVSVKLLEKRHEHMTAACYDPNTNEISIYTKGRAFADVCRSIAHEMVHQKQNELKMLEVNSGETGSDIENEANACAGIIMRNFGEIVGNLYD